MKLLATDNAAALALLKRAGLPVFSERGEVIYLNNREPEIILRAGRLLYQSDIGILRLEEENKSLEDIFLSLVGRSI